MLLTPPLPDAPQVRVPFDVQAEPENRLVFATLRSTVALRSVALIDPTGRELWRLTAAELGRRPRQTMPQPERGDGYFPPQVRDASTGRWQLLVEREPSVRGVGRLELAYSVFPRYELHILPASQTAAAGQPVLITVRPRDYGAPITGLPGVVVQVVDVMGRIITRVSAVEQARSREGIVISSEPGTYLATLALPDPGRYRLEVTQRLGKTAASARTATAEWVVGAAVGGLSLQAVRLDSGTGSCARGLLLDFDVRVQQAGLYACNLSLREGNASARASASAELQAGGGRITVAVSAAKLAAVGLPWQRLHAATLVQVADTGFRVAAELADVDLATYDIDFAALCR